MSEAGRSLRLVRLLGSALAEASDLVLTRACGGCNAPGTRWCGQCALTLAVRPSSRILSSGLVVWSVAEYDGPVREAINGWKDHARTDLTALFARALHTAVDALVAPSTPIALTPAPSSAIARRTRGREPVRDLCNAVAASERAWVLPALRHVRQVRDQAGLRSAARAENLVTAMAVRPGWAGALGRRPLVVVDDVVTTGATLTEAARALAEAGGAVLGAVTVAATRLRSQGAPEASGRVTRHN